MIRSQSTNECLFEIETHLALCAFTCVINTLTISQPISNSNSDSRLFAFKISD